MRKLLRTMACAALLAGAAVASAHAEEGWYGRIDVGYSIDGELDVSGVTTETPTVEKVGPQNLIFGSSAELENDWMASGAIGYGYGNGWRSELELSYRTNDVSGVSESVDATALMINLFYDFNREGWVQPYLGIGAGYVRTDAGSEDASGLALQGLAGLAFPINERLKFDLGYRYFTAEDLDFSGVDASYEHQAVTVGLRYQFHAAAAPPPPPPPVQQETPPPPPPPVACPTSEFVVYFEWDRSNLNQDALNVIDQAVARARQCNVNAITVIGHTDTSGSNTYNQGLSERRAAVVRDALVARGLSAASMTTQARGETDLARATRDGVREPLNRRTAVTIIFR